MELFVMAGLMGLKNPMMNFHGFRNLHQEELKVFGQKLIQVMLKG